MEEKYELATGRKATNIHVRPAAARTARPRTCRVRDGSYKLKRHSTQLQLTRLGIRACGPSLKRGQQNVVHRGRVWAGPLERRCTLSHALTNTPRIPARWPRVLAALALAALGEEREAPPQAPRGELASIAFWRETSPHCLHQNAS